jgi:hypothetical protein
MNLIFTHVLTTESFWECMAPGELMGFENKPEKGRLIDKDRFAEKGLQTFRNANCERTFLGDTARQMDTRGCPRDWPGKDELPDVSYRVSSK